MPIVKISNFAGIDKDELPHELPPNVFSGGGNVRFFDGHAEKMLGHSEVYATPSVSPYFAIPVSTATTYYWVYASLTKAYVTDGANHYNITRQTASVDVDYSADADINWTGGILNSIPILNNGVDSPQMWNPVSTSQRLQELSNWPANTTAKVIRPFGYFLVALDVTKTGTRYEHLVKWSSSADPGAVPASWDEADTTKDAGEVPLAGSPGFLIDCMPLRDVNIIYKEDSTWGMQYVGGNKIFRFWQIFKDTGILSRRCMANFQGKHIVLTQGDLIIHDGQNWESIVDARVRRWLFNTIDATNYQRCYIVPNYAKSEMWICIPSQGQSFPDIALVWRWRDNTFGFRDIPSASHIAYGVVDPSDDATWDADSGTWNSDSTVWDLRAYNPTQEGVLICDPTNTKLFQGDNTNQFNGTSFYSYVEREGLAIAGQKDGNISVDLESIKHIKAVWPRINANSGTQVDIYVGSQMRIGDSISWGLPKTFTVGTDYKVDIRTTGRLIAIRFETNGNVAWQLDGFDIEYELRGIR